MNESVQGNIFASYGFESIVENSVSVCGFVGKCVQLRPLVTSALLAALQQT